MRLPNNLEIAVFAYNRPSHLRRVLISLEDYKIKKINHPNDSMEITVYF